jgi:hypothetical protein
MEQIVGLSRQVGFICFSRTKQRILEEKKGFLQLLVTFHITYTVKPVYNDQPWDPKKRPLTVGRCLEVIYLIKVPNGTLKWWSL